MVVQISSPMVSLLLSLYQILARHNNETLHILLSTIIKFADGLKNHNVNLLCKENSSKAKDGEGLDQTRKIRHIHDQKSAYDSSYQFVQVDFGIQKGKQNQKIVYNTLKKRMPNIVSFNEFNGGEVNNEDIQKNDFNETISINSLFPIFFLPRSIYLPNHDDEEYNL